MKKFLAISVVLAVSIGSADADTPSLKEYLARWERLDPSLLSTTLLLSSPSPCPTFFCLATDETDQSCKDSLGKYLSEYPDATQRYCEKMEVVLEKRKSTGHPLEANFVCRSTVSVAIRSDDAITLEKGVLEFCEESPTKGNSIAGISGQGKLYNSKLQEICRVRQIDDVNLDFQCVFGNFDGSFLATRGSGRDTEIFASDGITEIFLLTRRKLSNVKARFPEIFK